MGWHLEVGQVLPEVHRYYYLLSVGELYAKLIEESALGEEGESLLLNVSPHFKQLTNSQQREEQALKVAWRILKDWVEAQLAVIESGQISASEAYFPYLVDPTSGMTLYQVFEAKGLPALTGSQSTHG